MIKRIFSAFIITLGSILCLGIASFACFKAYTLLNEEPVEVVEEEPVPEQKEEPIVEEPKEDRISSFTFNGVGDNLLHDPIFLYHEQDYGNRDYSGIYELTKKYSTDADLAYINFETVCAGDEFGLSGYPNFNGPLEMLDTLATLGYDWFSTSSNHSMDTGYQGLQKEMNYIEEKYPEIQYTGTHLSKKRANKPKVIEVNGIKVGICGFTYGLNGYHKPEDMPWLIDVFMKDDGTVDYELIDSRLDAIEDISDVQIVSIHWGDEYQTTPNKIQKEVAEYLNKKGVEVIIGSHPHVIQPCEFIESENQKTLCYYSLGNFLSAQDANDRMIGGMADFTLQYNFDTEEVIFKDVKFIPTITWISNNLREYKTTTINEYTDEMAQTHFITLVQGEDITPTYVNKYVQEVIGEPEGIEIVS